MKQTRQIVQLALLVVVLALQGCGNADGTRVEKTYWPGGTLRREVTMKDSLRHGPSRNYYRSGKIRLATEWENDIPVGEAVTYYEDGAVYQVTPFAAGIRQGIQRRYYPGGELMAEMPYSGGELVQGLREYDRKGQLLTPEVHIVFELRKSQTPELLMHLSDGCTQVQFSHYLNQPAEHYALETIQGQAILHLHPDATGSLSQKVTILGERKSPLGNKQVFRGEYVVE